MEIRAYCDEYLDDAQDTLGNMMDYALNICMLDGEDFFHMFISSGIAEQFEHGNPKYLSGMTGGEIVKEIMFRTKKVELQELEEYYLDKTPEYWCGWILAYYQWKTCRSFKKILQVITVQDILYMYPTQHEADEEHFVSVLNRIFQKRHTETYLKQKMENLKVSAEELSRQTEVPEELILALMQDFSEIKKVDALTLYKISRVLQCDMEDIMEV
ncbi:MAG: helix-turn-helix transcriptional regulator [Hespellia sp.]|nr:helix-turn-helix transcriptional regulator [Hespellia sp.]